MALPVQSEDYIRTAVMNVNQRQALQYFASQLPYTIQSVIPGSLHGKKAVFTVVTVPDGDETAVNPAIGPLASVDPKYTTVEVDLNLMHNQVLPCTAEGPLWGTLGSESVTYLMNDIKAMGGIVSKDIVARVKAALLTDIPNSGAYTWGADGETKAYASTCTGSETAGGHTLVLNGTVFATPKAAPVNITAGEQFNDPNYIDILWSYLDDNGATPLGFPGGSPVYNLIIGNHQFDFLKNNANFEADMQQFPASEFEGLAPLLTHNVNVYRGMIMTVVPTAQMRQAAAVVGAAGQAIDSVIAHGADYLLRAGLPTAQLPIVESQVLERFPASDISEIRVLAQGDGLGMNRQIGAATYAGWGIGLPEAGFRMNVSST